MSAQLIIERPSGSANSVPPEQDLLRAAGAVVLELRDEHRRDAVLTMVGRSPSPASSPF